MKADSGVPGAVGVNSTRPESDGCPCAYSDAFDSLSSINITLPRVRDFRGISAKAFDGRGNYTVGLRDQLIFPEVDFGKVDKARGLNVCIVTTANTDEEARSLLRHFGMPFRQ